MLSFCMGGAGSFELFGAEAMQRLMWKIYMFWTVSVLVKVCYNNVMLLFWVRIYVIWVLVFYGWFSVHIYLHLLLHHDWDPGGDWWGLGSEAKYGHSDPCRAHWRLQSMYCHPFCFTGTNVLNTFFLKL